MKNKTLVKGVKDKTRPLRQNQITAGGAISVSDISILFFSKDVSFGEVVHRQKMFYQ